MAGARSKIRAWDGIRVLTSLVRTNSDLTLSCTFVLQTGLDSDSETDERSPLSNSTSDSEDSEPGVVTHRFPFQSIREIASVQ